jgi:hypothetical protein
VVWVLIVRAEGADIGNSVWNAPETQCVMGGWGTGLW